MKNILQSAFIFFLLLGTTKQIDLKALIWDIGHTLFKPSNNSIAPHLGYWDCLCVYFKHGGNCQKVLGEIFMDILTEPGETREEFAPKDPDGRPLPRLLVHWFEGKLFSEEVLEKAMEQWKNYKKTISKRKRRMIGNTLQWMFDPSLFAESMKPIPQAVKLLKDCSRAKENGKLKNSLYIISNLDAESFSLMYKKQANKTVFNYFKPQNIYISAFLRDVKPRPSFFKHLLRRADLNPNECIFIDDQIENVKSAELCGLTALHLKDGNYKTIRDALKKYGAL